MASNVDKIQIRMYRFGTGDCFFLQFMKKNKVSFRMMIDCGCINANKASFSPVIEDLEKIPGPDRTIDLLVVTHEHADHINGFEKCADLFSKFTFKNIWFAWTEDDQDELANHLRKYHSELNLALNNVVNKLTELENNNYYAKIYASEIDGNRFTLTKEHFIQSLTSLHYLNPGKVMADGTPLPTMVELFKDYNIIKEDNLKDVKCWKPGNVINDLPGAEGISFYILGPPYDTELMDRTEIKGETYEKRESKSVIDFSFLSALGVSSSNRSSSVSAFEPEYEALEDSQGIMKIYNQKNGEWRKIDHDWLFGAGSLAMRYEKSINNTSLVLAIQFEESEKVLLFTGDAEYGNWQGWHSLDWPVRRHGRIINESATYFLNRTVFYKVGHHLSQNGTAKGKGIDMMQSPELTAMASLHFKKILSGWLKTMPNDLLGAELIRKTRGKLYLAGDCKKILKNIKTDRVTVSKEDEETVYALNQKFDGENYVECVIEG